MSMRRGFFPRDFVFKTRILQHRIIEKILNKIMIRVGQIVQRYMVWLLFSNIGFAPLAWAQSIPVTAGYRDFEFGPTTNAEPTFGKTESKLWWNDGSWWGVLWNAGSKRYEIYRFNAAKQNWIATNTAVDTRNGSRPDVLWDGQRLYVASHFYTTSPGPTTAIYFSKLYRYSYNQTTKKYSGDPGFPVNINSSKSETLTIDKDTTGKLWITWIEKNKIMINCTVGNDLTWGTPFVLPVQGINTDPDDISGLAAFGSNKIGVMWSNQKDSTIYFAVHVDGTADKNWKPREIALSGLGLGRVAEDHFCLKPARDNSGNLFAVTQTNLSGAQSTSIFVLKRSALGAWTRHVFSTVGYNHSRPQLVVDSENQRLHVFARSNDTGPANIYLKSVSLNDLVFPSGLGIPVIQSVADVNLTNPAATKQNVNRTTGLLILAADKDSRYYLHSKVDLNNPPQITAFSPVQGVIGTPVTMIGKNFTDVAAVKFNGIPATFTVLLGTQLHATVPVGATTGTISLTNSTGIGTTLTNFVIQRALKVSTLGSGNVTMNPPGGVYNEGLAVTLTAVPTAGWFFHHWNGQLDGTNATATITMNTDKNVTADFRELGKFSVTVNVNGAGNIALSPPGGLYFNGTMVTLVATPAPGYVFSGYSGGFKGWKNIEALSVNGNKILTATFTPQPVPRFAAGIWTSAAEISKLPAAGLAWNNLKAGADKPIGKPNLADFEDSVNVAILAKALVYARTGNETYRQAVITACMQAIGTEGAETLALGRELLAYVLAADLVKLPANEDAKFRTWLRTMLTKNIGSQSLRSSNESRPNNWGTHCGATRAAIACYLGDATELERTARIFKGWLGDRKSYVDFAYSPKELGWQSNPAAPVGINPVGAKIQGHSVDGVLPDDQRRAGPFTWPPVPENYVYGALQGALMQATILYRAGYDVWNWQNQALRRAMQWLYTEANYPADGDDEWLPHIVNHFYDATFPAPLPAPPGKNAGWTDWLYGSKYALTKTDNNGDIEIQALGFNTDSLAVFKLTAIPYAGYSFKGWSGSLSGAKNPDTLVMDANKNVIANFVNNGNFTLTITPVGSGTVTLNPPGGIYAGGTTVTLTAQPAAGFKFTGWSKGLSGSTNPASLMISANKNITATFKPVYRLNVEVIGAGKVTLFPPSGLYENRTVVTLIATPDSGQQFLGWNGDLSGTTNPLAFVMNANKNATANFTAERVVHEETQTGGSSFDATVATTASLSGGINNLYLAAITTRPKIKVNAVAGLGLSWKQVKAQCSGRNNLGVELWMAQGTPAAAGAVTAALASPATNAVIAVTRYSGASTATPLSTTISGNTKGVNGTCTGGFDNASYSFDLNTTDAGATIYGVAGLRNKTHTPAIGSTERAEIKQGTTSNVATIAVVDKIVPLAGATTFSGTFSGSTDWAVIAVVIKPLATGLASGGDLTKARANSATPKDLVLLQNYPNPFNPATVISYALPQEMRVALNVYNLTGQLVATLVEGLQPAGQYDVSFDATHLPSGNYFTVLQAGETKLVRRITLMK